MRIYKVDIKINVLHPLLKWMNGHCGCIELIEYILLDNLYVVFGDGIKKL